ncbi:MAG: hypothetical protein E6Z53_05110 [Pantoea sp.]|nr:hypothetical protein [Pantoea sp.]
MKRRAITVLLDKELERRLKAEIERIEKQTGYKPTLTAIASKAMERGFSDK